MSPYTEIQALVDINEALERLSDTRARARVLRWAVDKFSEEQINHNTPMKDATVVTTSPPASEPKTAPSTAATPDAAGETSEPKRKKTRSSATGATSALTINKELNLRPNGKQSFKDFAKEKAPNSQLEKSVVAVYYLTHFLNKDSVHVRDVLTCYREQGWRLPSDLRNTVQSAASRNGWLDTSDTTSIMLTPAGENLVTHDLPRGKQT